VLFVFVEFVGAAGLVGVAVIVVGKKRGEDERSRAGWVCVCLVDAGYAVVMGRKPGVERFKLA